MRILIGVVAIMFGCAAPWGEPSQVLAAQASGGEVDDPSLWPACPDRPDCARPNGTGVYFEEGGLAAMGPSELMIMRFINTASGVDVLARYHQKDTGYWEFTRGKVEGMFTSTGLAPVVAMGATGTIPTWRVAAPSPPGGFVDLTDTAVVGQRLALGFPVEKNGPRLQYAFWLNNEVIESTHPTGGPSASMYKFLAFYQPMSSTWSPSGPMRGYCVDGHSQPDPVMFQEGIAVDPVVGSVTRPTFATNMVTLSCRKGAIATVFSWGYRYLGLAPDTFYFDAGIHMKRASYCADAEAYTTSGVTISIEDNRAINMQTNSHIEAWWTPAGALCLGTLRRPDIAAAKGFSNSCATKIPPNLPACPPRMPSTQWLRDWVP